MKNFIFGVFVLLFFQGQLHAQDIKGKVLDENGMGLPGVSVSSSNSSTVSDIDGNFTINTQLGESLKFTFLGYQDRNVSASNNMSVTMTPANTNLEEVVVIGYGTQRKADITGSIAVVGEEEFGDRPNANAASSLQGKVAGVNIVNSGRPGVAPSISIRGIGSISGNNVLYVVDGILTNDITYLNPTDIESMSILKDASSSAIYGIRASAGVIVITTKLGKQTGVENIKFSYDTNVGFSTPTNVPDLANSSDYVRLYNQKLDYEGIGSPDTYLDLADFNGTDTDWMDEILRETSFTQTHNISMTGASEKTQYSAGLGYFTQDGVLDANNGVSSGDDYKRITARFNGLYKVTDRFRINANMAYYKHNTNDPANPFYQARVAVPILAPFNPDGTYASLGDIIGNQAGNINPRFTLDNYRGKTKGTRTIISGYGEYDILKDLSFKMNYSRDYRTSDAYQYTPELTALGTGTVQPSQLTNSMTSFESILWENTLTWNKTFDKHRIVVLAGYSRQQDRFKELKGQAQGVPFNGDDSTLYLGLVTSANTTGTSSGDKTRLQSYFGRLQYAFDNKYLLNATVRRDGTSAYNFDGDQKSATFPSVGIGWVISEEGFMQNSGIDFLKFKASWGRLGNASISRQYDLVATQQPGAFFGTPSQAYNAVSITQLFDTSIDWEVVEEQDFGIELKTLNSRLSLEAGYYNRETSDAVFPIAIPSQAGLGTSFVTNAGSFRNKGFEFDVRWNDAIGEKFTYSIYGNLTTIDNEITEVLGGSFLNTGPGIFGNPVKRWEVGEEIGAYYGYQVAGVIQNESEAAEYGSPVGSLRFADLDGNNIIDENDKTFLGSPIPTMTYGFGFSIGYSNVDFAMEFQGVAGNEIYNFNRNVRFANENWDQNFADNSWSPANPSNSYPAPNSDQVSSRPSSFYVEKGDYFRIRTIQLGYTLPKTFLDNIKIDNLRLYVSAQNPFTSFKYNGFSPEIGGQDIQNLGIDNNVYPLSAIYSFGLNLNF